LSEEETWLAETYLPLVVNEAHPEALSEIGIAVKAYGVKGFLRILQSSPLPTQVRLLSQIFEVMPEGVRQELRAALG
jgi:ribosomal 30S subunit maturation factor RimM